MRRSDIFKTLTACIIMSNEKQRSVIIRKLRDVGIKQFLRYSSFKEAAADFTKYYSVACPDFIVANSTPESDAFSGNPLADLPLLVLAKGVNEESELKLTIMNMFKRKFKIC
ncbi:hypothetical protein [Chitinophaga filiformis]|uniref:Response regulatory domain-containing protein n=1 Tax=Chitinophaga filiformis TaxID=104663 RepID=A0A1G7GZV3_CHIFI|nr:hypothetical protein [Chitinophaga filiformis]SDE93604.1 hypothetical protein SAMN04488121_101234 [Chitinophaga filiformis]